MCIYTKSKKPLVATEDMTCYKTFRVKKNNKDNTETYHPLWRVLTDFTYHIGKIKEEENIEAGLIESICYSNLYETTKGFYSYKELNFGWILFLSNTLNIVENDNMQTFKCIIPKGSLYYSETGLYGTELVSNKIMLKELVDKDTLRQFLSSNDKFKPCQNPFVFVSKEDDAK